MPGGVFAKGRRRSNAGGLNYISTCGNSISHRDLVAHGHDLVVHRARGRQGDGSRRASATASQTTSSLRLPRSLERAGPVALQRPRPPLRIPDLPRRHARRVCPTVHERPARGARNQIGHHAPGGRAEQLDRRADHLPSSPVSTNTAPVVRHLEYESISIAQSRQSVESSLKLPAPRIPRSYLSRREPPLSGQ